MALSSCSMNKKHVFQLLILFASLMLLVSVYNYSSSSYTTMRLADTPTTTLGKRSKATGLSSSSSSSYRKRKVNADTSGEEDIITAPFFSRSVNGTWREALRRAIGDAVPGTDARNFSITVIPEVLPGGEGQVQLKKILYWNDFYDRSDFAFGEGRRPFLQAGCPISTCTATSDRRRYPIQDLDAIIWTPRGTDKSLPPKKLRVSHTRYVYFLMEPPIYAHYTLQNLRNIFNYTMTFYRDSDIYNPYGLFVRRRHPQLELEGKDYAAGKSKMAVWFASHCPTRSLRERLVKELQKHVSVTTYGGCGVNSCPIMDTQNSDRCLRIMEKLYKFYLAFENALCTEYVTEKFFGAARFDMVPVVYGFADYSAVAPPHSYINVLDFPSVKHLADYLLYLDRNHTAYNQYFRWKVEYESLMYYRALKPHDYNNISWCQLCEKLHTDNQTKSYRSLAIWPPRATCLNHKNRHIKSFVSGAQTRLL